MRAAAITFLTLAGFPTSCSQAPAMLTFADTSTDGCTAEKVDPEEEVVEDDETRSTAQSKSQNFTATLLEDDDTKSAPKSSAKLVTYEDEISGLISKHCLTCHGADGTASPSLAKWTDVKKHRAALTDSVADGSMPNTNKALPADDKRAFADWKKNNYAENAPNESNAAEYTDTDDDDTADCNKADSTPTSESEPP